MSAEPKTQSQTSNFEIDPPSTMSGFSQSHRAGVVQGARSTMTLLGLCAGVIVLGVSADSLAVYDATHVPASYSLPLWPEDFDLRPTVALVVCSAIVVIASGCSVVADRLSFVRNNALMRAVTLFLAPLTALVAALIAMSFFYAVNASNTSHTLQSWSCRWEGVFMTSRPHFGTLCRQSRAGLYLSVLLVPLEVVVVGLAAWQVLLERTTEFVPRQERRKEGSPVPSSLRHAEAA